MMLFTKATMTCLIAFVVLFLCVSSEVRGFQSLVTRVQKRVRQGRRQGEPVLLDKQEEPHDSTIVTQPQVALPQKQRSFSQTYWDDLTPPFAIQDFFTNGEEELEQTILSSPNVTHFCFLVHGHRGYAKDLSYLETIMQLLAERVKRRQNETILAQEEILHDMVVHSAICNEQRTSDGVEKGGERLVEEIISVIETEMDKRIQGAPKKNQIHHVTLSLVGNSLGGIYSRYAIAQLAKRLRNGIWNNKYKIHFNVFCTTASPHLGISQHTYVPLPRTAEIGVAHALGETGHDLFRLNDLMKTMATSKEYLSPLGSFRKRIAYANAYGTDFPVPHETAAFLNPNSTYPHYFVEQEESDANGKESDNDSKLVVDDNGLIIATLHTRRNDSSGSLGDEDIVDEEHTDELVQMSTALDSLGWKKVFVDIRSEIPIGVPLGWLSSKKSNGTSTWSFTNGSRRVLSFILPNRGSNVTADNDDNDQPEQKEEEEEETPPLHVLKEKGGVLESRDLVSTFARENRLHLPIGHNMICAFSRSRISTLLNKGGRPVMDTLARELVRDIFSWSARNNEKS